MNKTVLVTGATSGFGLEIARIFAKNGNTVCITGRRGERLEALKKELETAYGVKIITLQFDVRDRAQVEVAIRKLKDEVSNVDILVNNAGLASGLSSIDEGDFDDWDVMIDTNVKGLLNVTRHVVPMMKHGGAHIINISSTAAKTVYKNGNVYCATKYAVDALTQSLRIDLLPYGIKVTAVNPGMAETEFSIVRFKGDTERAKTVYQGFQALKAEDVANVVYFCTTLPKHVCLNDITMSPLSQANSVYNVKDVDRLDLKP